MRKTVLLLLAAAPLALAGSTWRDDDTDDAWTQADLERVAAEIQVDVERLVGRAFTKPVSVQLADKQGFLDHAMHRLERFVPRERMEADELLARMLGLIPADMDLLETTLALLASQVGGFYSPDEDRFYLMESFVGPAARVILAHELTHALDDQHFDIDAGLVARMENSDASLAYSAVVEGSGTAVMNQWMLEAMKAGQIGMMDLLKLQEQTLASDTPAYLWVPLISAYLCGASFLNRTDSILKGQTGMGSAADVARAFADPPASSEQVLHPDKYWRDGARDEPRQVEFDTSKLGRGWSELRRDTLGELGLAILATAPSARPEFDPQAIASTRFTNELASGWGGDRVVLLAKGEGRFLRLVTLWDSERDAAEFYGALRVLADALEKQLVEVERHELGTAGRSRAALELRYGAPDEVILEAAFGLRRADQKAASEGLVHREAAR